MVIGHLINSSEGILGVQITWPSTSVVVADVDITLFENINSNFTIRNAIAQSLNVP
jgi:hypothetical protein